MRPEREPFIYSHAFGVIANVLLLAGLLLATWAVT